MSLSSLSSVELDEYFAARIGTIGCNENRESLAAYVYEERNRVEPGTIAARLDALLPLAKFLRDRHWLEATRNDIILVITTHRFQRGAGQAKDPSKLPWQNLAPSTKYQFKVHMQHFYKHLRDTDDTPPQFKRLPFQKHDVAAEQARELALKPDEVQRLFSGARSLRDKAIIMVAVEGGWRAGELAALRLDCMETRRLSNGELGYYFTLNSSEPGLKTGPRSVPVPIIAGATVLKEYLERHPRKHANPPYLFVTESNRSFGNRMTNRSIADAIARCAQRAGMRHVHAHMLRHTSTTLKLVKGMNPAAVKKLHGWTRSSMMLQHYEHAEPHFDRMVLEAHGLEPSEPAILDIIGSQPCPGCGARIEITTGLCESCGQVDLQSLADDVVRGYNRDLVGFVAEETAKSLGWKRRNRQAGQFEAIEFLSSRFEAETGEQPDGPPFTKWCMKLYAKSL